MTAHVDRVVDHRARLHELTDRIIVQTRPVLDQITGAQNRVASAHCRTWVDWKRADRREWEIERLAVDAQCLFVIVDALRASEACRAASRPQTESRAGLIELERMAVIDQNAVLDITGAVLGARGKVDAVARANTGL